jgi:hypothetical protein
LALTVGVSPEPAHDSVAAAPPRREATRGGIGLHHGHSHRSKKNAAAGPLSGCEASP